MTLTDQLIHPADDLNVSSVTVAEEHERPSHRGVHNAEEQLSGAAPPVFPKLASAVLRRSFSPGRWFGCKVWLRGCGSGHVGRDKQHLQNVLSWVISELANVILDFSIVKLQSGCNEHWNAYSACESSDLENNIYYIDGS